MLAWDSKRTDEKYVIVHQSKTSTNIQTSAQIVELAITLRTIMSENMTRYLSLVEISDQEARQRMPTVVYLCILIILGILGNSLVLIVYLFKYKGSNLRLYILCLAMLDMLACCVSMPAEVVDNYRPYMFYSDSFCKAQRFLGNMAKIGSAFVITLMAIERHRRICGEFTSALPKYTRRYCGCAIVLTFLFSWPKAVISGTILEQFPGNVTGYDCSVEESLINTPIPFIYTVVQLTIFLVSIVLLVVLYTLIVKRLCHQSRQPSHSGSERGLIMMRTSRKVTRIMFAISVAFLISYLPHFIITILSTLKQEKNLIPPSSLVLGTLPLFYRSYFINNVVNPFIYAVGDQQFRTICIQYFRWFIRRNQPDRNTDVMRDDSLARDNMLRTNGMTTESKI